MTPNQLMADIAEAEAEEWAEAKGLIDRKVGGWPEDWERIAESAFKAGLNAGAQWAVRYLKQQGLL